MENMGDGFVPERPHADVPVSDETRTHLDRINDLYEAGQLYEGDTGDVSQSEEVRSLLRESQQSLAEDLRRFLGADGESITEDSVRGAVPRVNMWMQMISWTSGDGWTYWGVHDYLRDQSRYLGRTRGRELEF